MKATPKITYVPTHIRQGTIDDASFIYSSWLRSYRDHSSYADFIPKEIYYKCQARVIENLLKNCGVSIACNPEDNEQIFGYVVYSPSNIGVSIIHYIYVKHPYRRLGIATTLKEYVKHETCHDNALPLVATHETGMLKTTFAEKWNIIFNPYLLGAIGND